MGDHYMILLGDIWFAIHSVKVWSAQGGHQSLRYSNKKYGDCQ